MGKLHYSQYRTQFASETGADEAAMPNFPTMNYIILDIETVPNPDLVPELEPEVERKVNQRQEKSDLPAEELESLIRSTSPFFGQVLCIGLRWFNEEGDQVKDHVVCGVNEQETLQEFFRIINSPQTRQVRFVHYNGLGFDIPFLIVRAIHYGIDITNYRFKNLRRFTFDAHIDLMMYLCNWNNYNSVPLATACLSMGIPSPKEGDVKGDSVAQAFKEGNVDAVKEYVMRDVDATYLLFRKIHPYL